MPNREPATPERNRTARIVLHPLAVRLAHWTFALATVLLIGSGWRMHNFSGFFGFVEVPIWMTIGGSYEGAQRVHGEIGLAGALLWHFAAMWLLFGNGLVYLACNVASGRLARQFFPLSPRAVLADLRAALGGRLSHADPRRYNAVQKLAYLFVMVDSVLLVLSGLVLWKSVQFPLLRELMGGYEAARRVHFLAMAGLVGFVVVHLAMVALVPRTLLAMIRGR